MDDRSLRYMQQLENEREVTNLDNLRLKKDNMGMVSAFAGSDNSNLVVFQLDLSEEKDIIDHLLRGHVIRRDEKGNEYWAEPIDPTQKSLTNYGVEKLMNIINFYLSRNIILSNYSAEQIDNKMKDLGWEIADALFLEYEHIFYKPKYEDLLKRDLDLFTKLYLKYINNDKEKFYKETIAIISKYDNEIENIYSKNKKQYPLICRLLIDSIHSAYLRAFRGEERATLRKVMMVTQNQSESMNNQRSANPNAQRSGGRSLWHPSTWVNG